jgi:hypothetical protein
MGYMNVFENAVYLTYDHFDREHDHYIINGWNRLLIGIIRIEYIVVSENGITMG